MDWSNKPLKTEHVGRNVILAVATGLLIALGLVVFASDSAFVKEMNSCLAKDAYVVWKKQYGNPKRLTYDEWLTLYRCDLLSQQDAEQDDD